MVIFSVVLIKCRFQMTFLALSLLSISISVAADVGAGRDIYIKTCVACHGIAADGNDAIGAPALAGQQERYLARQLANYNQSIRGADKSDRFGQQMVAISELVNEPKQQANVSAYLASLAQPITSVTSDKTGDGNRLGYKVYQASCGACHGADASGNERLNSPSLVGLSSAYISRQYANFINGKRGSHKTDKLGRQMSMIAKTVSEQDKIDAVIAYIVSLQD